jgi:hypothetical protein
MRMHCVRLLGITAIATAFLLIGSADAKPIAFANGTTAMAEYGAGTMIEVQAFYAPTYRYSIGGSYLQLQGTSDDQTRDILYARLNYLPKRWNFEDAQANVFVWGGVGGARVGETHADTFAWNVGGQIDYETRRVYGSFRTDLHESSAYSHRIDTLQIGLAPYKHDYQTLAIWFVVQARNYTGGLYDGVEWAGLVRFFKRNVWLEAGVTIDSKLQAMMMVNF